MSTKKISIVAIFFVIAGFFLTGYIFAGEDGNSLESGDLAKLKEEQKILSEKVAELEDAIKLKEASQEENTENEIIIEPENKPEEVPGSNKVLVAYVKDEYSSVNTRVDIGTDQPVVEKVPQKSPMVIIESKDDWYRVKLESGSLAWVASWVVRVQEE